ncbi:hypothetical protein [Streptomyces sp. NPDC003006]
MNAAGFGYALRMPPQQHGKDDDSCHHPHTDDRACVEDWPSRRRQQSGHEGDDAEQREHQVS